MSPFRVRERVAHALESGALPRGGPLEALAETLGRRALARPLALDADVRVVTVGGATVGGSGRTRVAIAVARVLAEAGRRPALIGHGYRATLRASRRVATTDDLDLVGDEALVCAAALRGADASVIVGPDRASAAHFALQLGASVLVFDGPLQLAPRRADLALLAVDAQAPWGAGRVLPFGDLRAPPEALRAAADAVVEVGRALDVRGVPARVGLFTALARPQRVVTALAEAGVVPVVAVGTGDHGAGGRRGLHARLREAERVHGLEAWLATAKCALHLARLGPERPVVVLEDGFTLPADVRARVLAHTHVHGVP